ncbi:ulp1 protease family, C-terminal catalytic domain-containing protein [Tanacetum coccineum]
MRISSMNTITNLSKYGLHTWFMKSMNTTVGLIVPAFLKELICKVHGILEASKCQLFLPYGTNKVLCAIRMVYSAKQVHGKSVLQGHAKVHVDNVEAKYKDYLLPVPTKEFSKIGETASNSNQTGNKKIVATNTSTQTATKQAVATNKEPSTLKQTSPTLSRQEGPSNHIAAAPLTKSARPLNSASKEKQELIKRMNSYRGQILKRACVRSSYERWMRNADPTRSIHVDVEHGVFGQSESFQVSVTSGDLMLLFTNGLLSSSIITLFAASILKIMQAVNMQSNKWNFVECNQQRYYWECGYYVMKWMHQFVTHQQHSFPKTVPWNDKKPFTTKELDDIMSSCISVCRI